MNSYRYRVVIGAMQWALDFEVQDFATRLGDCTVRESSTADGRCLLTVDIRRDSHAQAMYELETALWQLGWSIAEATVEEWLDKVGQSVALTALGGAGGSRLGLAGAVFAGFVGFVAGQLAPPLIQVAEYQLVRVANGWQIRPAAGPGFGSARPSSAY